VKAPNIQILQAQLIIEAVVRCGVRRIFISPGSRSTPLVVAAEDHPSIATRVIIDERAAAYCALGYIQAAGEPAAVLCTSGTAAANYYPGVIEGNRSRLPLVILTADRPEELQNCGANQTINQHFLYGGFVRHGLTIEAPHEDAAALPGISSDRSAFEDLFIKILETLDHLSQGPVHLNCRFREPLAPVDRAYKPHEYDAHILESGRWNWSPPEMEAESVPAKEIESLLVRLARSQRVLIVCGPEASYRTPGMVESLAGQLGAPLIADVLSQRRHSQAEEIICHHDLYIDNDGLFPQLRPECVLHFGGLPTSKRLNAFLASCRGIDYFKFQNHEMTIDPDHLETGRFVGNIADIIEHVIAHRSGISDPNYLIAWQNAEKRAIQVLQEETVHETMSEPGIACRLSRLLSDSGGLFLSNSMPVRDAESFGGAMAENIAVGFNRGVSGIDGIIASACGFALGRNKPTALVIGDLAALHDLNSLALAAQSPVPIIVVIINNNGGGIFHQLPIAEFHQYFEPYFGTPHDYHFDAAAQMFGLPYFRPVDVTEFEAVYLSLRNEAKSGIIELCCDRRESADLRDKIRQNIKTFLDSFEI